jgi:hypothetical protein
MTQDGREQLWSEAGAPSWEACPPSRDAKLRVVTGSPLPEGSLCGPERHPLCISCMLRAIARCLSPRMQPAAHKTPPKVTAGCVGDRETRGGDLVFQGDDPAVYPILPNQARVWVPAKPSHHGGLRSVDQRHGLGFSPRNMGLTLLCCEGPADALHESSTRRSLPCTARERFGGHSKGSRQPADLGRIGNQAAFFDSAHVGWMNATPPGELHLCPASPQSEISDCRHRSLQ